MQQLNIGKKYKKVKKSLKIIKLIIRILISILTSKVAIVILTIVGIVVSIVGAIGNLGNRDTDFAENVPKEYIQYYNEVSENFNIPTWVLLGVSKQESNFNPNASYGGAYGIMQVQKNDIATGIDLWNNHINNGLGEEYNKLGYSFSNSEEMWNIYLKEPKVQIIAGAYILRHYGNYVLYNEGYINKLEYNNNANMNLINWNSNENDIEFSNIVRRIFACYNGGPSYGISVDLDNAEHNYPNKVLKYALEFRDKGISIGGTKIDNESIEKAIQAGMKWVGKSPYVWGGGRTQADVDLGRFDCSSFVHYMYASVGIQLGDRANVVTFSLLNMGEKIDPKDMQRGDILFFDTYTIDGHVGVYLGDGEFIHDADTNGVSISNINDYYWKNAFKGKVRRVVR